MTQNGDQGYVGNEFWDCRKQNGKFRTPLVVIKPYIQYLDQAQYIWIFNRIAIQIRTPERLEYATL